MSCRKLTALLLFAALTFVAVSCSDDDETEVLPSLSGLYFNCPHFVSPGQAVRLVPKGVKHPEGEEVGYCWKVTPTMTKNDTTEVYVHWFSDTLKTYTVNCYAFASDYYNASYSQEVVVIDGGLDKSITGTGIRSTEPKVTVDGVDYYYQRIGDVEWFRNNLLEAESGTPYANEDITSSVFGRFYNYNEAMEACPEGWRLPTEDDWMALAAAMDSPASAKYSIFENVASKLLADASFNSTKLLTYWPEVGDVTNSSKLSMLPFGYSNLGALNAEGKFANASFDGFMDYAVFWTADKVDEDMAYYRYIITDLPDMFVGQGDVNTFGASVRCVRDVK